MSRGLSVYIAFVALVFAVWLFSPRERLADDLVLGSALIIGALIWFTPLRRWVYLKYSGLFSSTIEKTKRVPTSEKQKRTGDFQSRKNSSFRRFQRSISTTDYGFGPYEDSVRDYVCSELISRFGFSPNDIETEFSIKIGSSTRRIDIAVFLSGRPHTQENIVIIVECKRAKHKNDDQAQEQLFSYIAACINARYGVLAASSWKVWEKKLGYTGYSHEEIEYLPGADDQEVVFEYKPPGGLIK